MASDEDSSIAVFLGPSLPLRAARPLLDAQVLPPAQFGDVYRLIGGHVRTIVLIDGVFHGRAPVWQREIVYALKSGIHVYGAGSMGALRAAELHGHGMVGLGSVFQSYMTGEIDGDDEVALLHAGPEQGYRPLSEPLVNLRFNLGQAAARGVLEPAQAAALVAAMKAMPFWERTLDALWKALAYGSLSEPRRAALRAFFEDHAIDLKREDAVQALLEVARRKDEPDDAPAAAVAATARSGPWLESSYYDRFRLLMRGLLCSSDHRLDGQALVDRVFSDPARRKLIQWSLGAQFFVREWAREGGVSVPPGELPALSASGDLGAWRRENGLTEAEHRELSARHLLWKWLLAQAPEQFGLSSALQDEGLLPPFPELGVLQPVCERVSLARALPYVAAWCQSAGAAPAIEATQDLAARWGGALDALRERHGPALREAFLQAIWAIEKGPIHFGFTTWSPAAEVLRELQITGTVAKLSASWGSTAP